MAKKYHISNGKLLTCDAETRQCPKQHVNLPAKMETPDQVWNFFDKSKINKTTENLTTLFTNEQTLNNEQYWHDLGEKLASSKTTIEEKKETLKELHEKSPYPGTSYQTLVNSKLFTTEELDQKYFRLPPQAQEQNFAINFENWAWEEKRNNESLTKYLTIAETLKPNLSSSNIAALSLMVSAITKNADNPEIIQKTAQYFTELNLYAKEYSNGYNQDTLLSNPHCNPKTADLICSNLARSGCYTELAKALTTYKERTGMFGEKTTPQNRLKHLQETHNNIAKTNPIPPFEENVPQNLKTLQKKETTSSTPIQTVLDSFQENHTKLSILPDDEDKIQNYIKNNIRITRITASENYRKTLAYYYHTIQTIKANNTYI